jgi:hypothetical protein
MLTNNLGAVEAGVKIAQAAVGNRYPKSFPHINVARAHVRQICEEKKLEFKTVSGVAPKQLAMYVQYNTARQAYEAGKFTLDEKPDTPYRGKWNARLASANASPPKAYKGYTRPASAATTTSRINSGAIKYSSFKETPKDIPIIRHVSPESHTDFIKTTSNGSVKTTSNGSIKTSSNDQSDIKLVDLGTPSMSTQDTIAKLGDYYPLIDLSTGVVGPNTLIDLGQPEIPLTEDLSALMDIFSGNTTMFKDEGLNVSQILRFETNHH